MTIEVIYEDADVIVINKPAGVLVHGVYGKSGPKHNEETLADWFLRNYPEVDGVGDPNVGGIERAGIVHRLDRDTSGIMIVARNQSAFEFLKKRFQNRQIQKIYIALVWGHVQNDEGVIEKPISIKDGSVKRTVFKGKMTREALTEYAVRDRYIFQESPVTLLAVMPKTGRTHQIRVHLNAIGHPVLGDKLYGKKPIPENLRRHFLHAESLTLTLPNGKTITLEAPLPDDLKSFFGVLETST